MFIKKLLEKRSQSNASSTTLQLVKKLNVPVTASTIVNAVEQHPSFPSLYSIGDSLKKWKIDSIALEVEPEKLEELPTPFIAHVKSQHGKFILVNSVNGTVDYIDEKGKRRQKTREDFNKDWDRVVLLAEANNASGEQNYKASRRKELMESMRAPAVIICCLVLTAVFAGIISNAFIGSLLFIKLLGSIITGLLLWFEVDKSNQVLKHICAVGKNINCTAILGSKQAKLFGLLSWSEIGFYYFTGGFLSVLLTNGEPVILSLLGWLNLLAVPYVFFSVFYQWRIAKQWCLLCLAVQAMLVLEFIACYSGYWYPIIGTAAVAPGINLLSLIACFLLPVFFWLLTKQVYLSAQNGKYYQQELSKLRFNPDIFRALLAKQRPVTVPADGLGITLGNLNASNTIIKVCNPYCGPCARAHPVIEDLLEDNADVKVQILFTATNDENDRAAKPVKHLMALYQTKDQALIKQALDHWYLSENKDYDQFAARFPLPDNAADQRAGIEAMNNWCRQMNITFTPTYFINGFQFPELYQIENLKYML